MSLHPPSLIPRVLSAFDRASNIWVALPSRAPRTTPQKLASDPTTLTHRPALRSAYDQLNTSPCSSLERKPQTVSLMTWNIQASLYKTAERATLILDDVLNGPESNIPDILFLQEVSPYARESILDHPIVRERFLTTDAEDDMAFRGVPFATMGLLSNRMFGVRDADSLLSPRASKLKSNETSSSKVDDQNTDVDSDPKLGPNSHLSVENVFRVVLPSKYARDALGVDFAYRGAPSGAIVRLFNVHLDSLDALPQRTLQMDVLARLLKEPRCTGGVIAGDFNATRPKQDGELIVKHGFVDAWLKLRGSGKGGETWGGGFVLGEGTKKKPSTRFDKVVMSGDVRPVEIEVLPPGNFRTFLPLSDHCGVRCTLTV